MPSKAALSALRALRDEVAPRAPRAAEPRPSITPEQMQEEMRRQALANVPEQKMLQGVYRGFAGENVPAKTAFGNETFFTSPQKRVADYYAKRRAAETGAEPHAEMLLVDPSDLRHNTYGLGLPIDKHNRDFLTTRARRVDPDEVKSRTPLYAEGGSVATFKDGGAATGFFPQMKPRRAENSGAGERMTEEALKFFIPQDTTDLALMAFPFGKAGKAAAAGLLALTPADAEAGKLKTGVDLARRSFFGLKPSQDMAGRELTTVQRDLDRMQAELNKVDKTAPKVEERAVSIDPGKGTAKAVDVVKKVADTPVSRRTVLKTAAGQVMQNALPASSFADLMKPATVAKQAVQAAAPAALSMDALPALLGEAIRKGMDEKQAVDYVRQLLPDAEKRYFVDDMYHTYKNPELFHVEGEPQGAGEIMRSMMGMKSGEIGGDPLSSMRPRIRAMRERAPEMYDELRQTAKDIAEYGFEP